MSQQISVYYDYTCPYSYRALHWLDSVQQAGRELSVTWKTFSIKEVNREAQQRVQHLGRFLGRGRY